MCCGCSVKEDSDPRLPVRAIARPCCAPHGLVDPSTPVRHTVETASEALLVMEDSMDRERPSSDKDSEEEMDGSQRPRCPHHKKGKRYPSLSPGSSPAVAPRKFRAGQRTNLCRYCKRVPFRLKHICPEVRATCQNRDIRARMAHTQSCTSNLSLDSEEAEELLYLVRALLFTQKRCFYLDHSGTMHF